jgi:hypothetical protein
MLVNINVFYLLVVYWYNSLLIPAITLSDSQPSYLCNVISDYVTKMLCFLHEKVHNFLSVQHPIIHTTPLRLEQIQTCFPYSLM